MAYTDTPVIELEGVGKHYGDHHVLRDVDLNLPSGVHALLGPNGAGKTTIVNILTTLIRHDRGTVRVLGLDASTQAARIRPRISVTGQFAAVDDVLTGSENLVMMGRLLGLSSRAARARAADLCERFDLEEAGDRATSTYSGGMRRRLDLAVSLIWPPEVLFLDEPTTGLDTRSRRTLWDEIRALAVEGTTVFLTTQYLEEADELADQIAVLNHGAIVAQGSAAHLKSLVGTEVLRVRDEHGQIVRELPTDGSAGALSRASAEVAARDPRLRVELHRPTLDDAFLKLTGHDAAGAPLDPDAVVEAAADAGAVEDPDERARGLASTEVAR